MTQPEGSLGHITDADRFVTDVAAVNKNERDAAIARKEQIYYGKRCATARPPRLLLALVARRRR